MDEPHYILNKTITMGAMNNEWMGSKFRAQCNFISLRKPEQSSQVSNTQINSLLDIVQSSAQEYVRYWECLIKGSIT